MLRFDVNTALFIASEMSRLATHLESLDDASNKWRSGEQQVNDCERIGAYRPFLKEVGMNMSLAQVNRICDACCNDEKSPLSRQKFCGLLRDLSLRMLDESESLFFLSLTPKEARYFEPQSPLFGVEFKEGFPTEGAFELDEAAKCLALGRSTAAVFHLMRVMEVGIQALSRCLGIADPVKPSQRNWGLILKAVKEEGIDKRWPSHGAKLLANAEIFDSLYVSLDAVRNPWRNATMHVENKYTDEEAEHIFVAVKGFMKKLASRMDEQGEPKA